MLSGRPLTTRPPRSEKHANEALVTAHFSLVAWKASLLASSLAMGADATRNLPLNNNPGYEVWYAGKPHRLSKSEGMHQQL